MSPMAWWLIPALSTCAAIAWTRFGVRRAAQGGARPEPGSEQDRAELAVFEAALRQPWIGRVGAAGGDHHTAGDQ